MQAIGAPSLPDTHAQERGSGTARGRPVGDAVQSGGGARGSPRNYNGEGAELDESPALSGRADTV